MFRKQQEHLSLKSQYTLTWSSSHIQNVWGNRLWSGVEEAFASCCPAHDTSRALLTWSNLVPTIQLKSWIQIQSNTCVPTLSVTVCKSAYVVVRHLDFALYLQRFAIYCYIMLLSPCIKPKGNSMVAFVSTTSTPKTWSSWNKVKDTIEFGLSPLPVEMRLYGIPY